MQEQNGVEKPILSDQATRWGIRGARFVRFHLLRQATHSLSDGQTIYSEDGPQEPRLSREFFDSKVGPLKSPTFRVPFSHPSHPGRAKRCGRRTH